MCGKNVFSSHTVEINYIDKANIAQILGVLEYCFNGRVYAEAAAAAQAFAKDLYSLNYTRARFCDFAAGNGKYICVCV